MSTLNLKKVDYKQLLFLLASYFILIILGSFFVMGFYLITRGSEIIQEDDTVIYRGKILKRWSIFWEQIKQIKRCYYPLDVEKKAPIEVAIYRFPEPLVFWVSACPSCMASSFGSLFWWIIYFVLHFIVNFSIEWQLWVALWLPYVICVALVNKYIDEKLKL